MLMSHKDLRLSAASVSQLNELGFVPKDVVCLFVRLSYYFTPLFPFLFLPAFSFLIMIRGRRSTPPPLTRLAMHLLVVSSLPCRTFFIVFNAQPLMKRIMHPSLILNFDRGHAFDSDIYPVLDSAFSSSLNSHSATNHSSDLNKAEGVVVRSENTNTWLKLSTNPNTYNTKNVKHPGQTLNFDPVFTLLFNPSHVLNFGSGPAFDSDFGPFLHFVPCSAFNSNSATSSNSDLNEAKRIEKGLRYKDRRTDTSPPIETYPGEGVKTEATSNGALSRLYIANANRKDSGNYTCALADVATAAVSVHVLRGENPLAMQRGGSPSLSTPFVTLCVAVLS
ncbi:hypothetical protein EVAR_100407_1 [Eumeta japonica]|uniref:Ig-like domain-containing protein n=1 Tax=Eumeta variegata TaxID=151549 RepID=A0A4C1ZRG3_EUMVA|nr:hypothetical protein EVAR_100407_1 [Eumeta japonica]